MAKIIEFFGDILNYPIWDIISPPSNVKIFKYTEFFCDDLQLFLENPRIHSCLVLEEYSQTEEYKVVDYIALSNFLKQNHTLSSLTLRLNRNYHEKIFTIIENLKEDNFLTVLKINAELGDNKIKNLVKAIKFHPTLKKISLFGNSITYKGAKEVAKLLKSNVNLENLDLGDNQICTKSILIIAESLKNNNKLLSLNLSYNKIDKLGSIEIAKLLENNNALEKLKLKNNEIGSEGATIIAESLKNNNKLLSLDLSYNEIGSEGTLKICELLRINTTFQELILRGNRIGDNGITKIAEGLQVNTGLQLLNVISNKIHDKGAKAFLKTFKVNTTLSNIYLNGNKISFTPVDKITTIVKENNIYLTYCDIFDSSAWQDGVIKRNTQITEKVTYTLEVITKNPLLRPNYIIDNFSVWHFKFFQASPNRFDKKDSKININIIKDFIKDKYFLLTSICKDLESSWVGKGDLSKDNVDTIVSFLKIKDVVVDYSPPQYSLWDNIEMLGEYIYSST